MDKSLLADATSNDDSPTPGYILNEISRATVASYLASTQLQEHLVSRLSKSNPNIKYKCLVIIKHVCRTGRVDFKRDITKHVDLVKECLQFRGPPDPLRGDEYYRRVREAAKEALEAMYDSQVAMSTSAVAAANRIQGIGGGEQIQTQAKPSTSGIFSSVTSTIQNLRLESDTGYQGHHGATGQLTGSTGLGYTGANYNNPASTVSPSSASTSNSLTGIGNPNFQDPRLEKSWLKRVSEAASNVSSSVSGDRKIGLIQESQDYSESYASNRGNNAYGLNEAGYSPATVHAPSNALASNVQNVYGPRGTVTGMNNSVVPDFPSNADGVGRVGKAISDGSYERQILESLCEATGLKPIPPEEKLKSFLNTISTLSPEIIGFCLIDLLNNDAWQSRVKALIVISEIIKANDIHKQWWYNEQLHDGKEIILGLSNTDSKVAVRNQANKTLVAFGVKSNSASRAVASGSPVVMQASPASGSLLELDSDYIANASTGTYSNNSSPMTTTQHQHQQDDIFNMLNTSPPPIPQSSTSSDKIVYSPNHANTISGMFDGLDVGGNSSNGLGTTSVASFNIVSTSSSTSNSVSNQFTSQTMDDKSGFSSFDFLSGSSSSVSSVPVTSNTNTSIFDNLSMSSKYPTTSAPFNSVPVTSIQQPIPPVIPASSAISNSFDDLLSMSNTSTVNKSAGLNDLGLASVYGSSSARPTGFGFINQTSTPQQVPLSYSMQSQTISTATPAMNLNVANRKVIPTQNDNGNSSFNFLDQGSRTRPQGVSNGGLDSFGFITDSMKAETTKK